MLGANHNFNAKNLLFLSDLLGLADMIFVAFMALAFIGMEVTAWAAHRYLMHGPLWFLHRDHHVPGTGIFQQNDWFALIFALPSFFSILFGSILNQSALSGFGFGIMAYGLAYLLAHEILIHRRIILFKPPTKGYLRAIVRRHQIHHQKREKENGRNFGMLWAPPSEW